MLMVKFIFYLKIQIRKFNRLRYCIYSDIVNIVIIRIQESYQPFLFKSCLLAHVYLVQNFISGHQIDCLSYNDNEVEYGTLT